MKRQNTRSSSTRSATAETSTTIDNLVLKRTVFGGVPCVVIPEVDFRRLLEKSDSPDLLPNLPPRRADGTYPAGEAIAVILARQISTRRRDLGWSQGQLAERAGIRMETVNRIELGKHAPSVRTVDKIERALAEAERQASRRNS